MSQAALDDVKEKFGAFMESFMNVMEKQQNRLEPVRPDMLELPNLPEYLRQTEREKIVIRDLEILYDRRIVTYRGHTMNVQNQEFELLYVLASRPGIVYNRHQLMDAMGMPDDQDDRAIDSSIKRLRNKFRELEPEFSEIQSVYGVGYRWRDPQYG